MRHLGFRLFFTAALALTLYGGFQRGLWPLWGLLPLWALGLRDCLQTRHTIRRNFPLVGHFRYLLEAIRPEINQYFVESNLDGAPFSREQRSVVYQRSKRQLDTLPFGTQRNVYEVGYEWATHSLTPTEVDPDQLRVTVGGPQCAQPYNASLLNVSAMSFGSLSNRAVLALNGGAKLGGFAHNTGEGGLSPYHLEKGGDLIWQVGTGYFGCRTLKGEFDPGLFRENAARPSVKMIELKLSQGAKPGHGGILPAAKVTPEIARIRNVPLGQDVNSPPAHSTFTSPLGLMRFIEKLRELSGGKPVGFKLCLGKRRQFLAIAKAMLETGITPDFITVDGGEGGTGAAPLEFSNSLGFPLFDALAFVHNALVGLELRSRLSLIASGKVVTGFDLISRLALGADLCNSARSMMLALGCIQALRCNSNHCPTGVATQDPSLVKGLVVEDKEQRVANYHRETLKSAAALMGAMGVPNSRELRPWHVFRRISPTETRHYGQIYPQIEAGALLQVPPPEAFARVMGAASASEF